MCVNVGRFDIILNESETEFEANAYLEKLTPHLSVVSASITEHPRRIKEVFESVDICKEIRVLGLAFGAVQIIPTMLGLA